MGAPRGEIAPTPSVEMLRQYRLHLKHEFSMKLKQIKAGDKFTGTNNTMYRM